jgi:hypothetical protein
VSDAGRLANELDQTIRLATMLRAAILLAWTTTEEVQLGNALAVVERRRDELQARLLT